MNEQCQKKVLRILELATMLNCTSTKQDCTGNKPTVFVKFSGHVCIFEVMICSKGWSSEEKKYDFCWYTYLNSEAEILNEKLDECLAKLTELNKEWESK